MCIQKLHSLATFPLHKGVKHFNSSTSSAKHATPEANQQTPNDCNLLLNAIAVSILTTACTHMNNQNRHTDASYRAIYTHLYVCV